jgi:tRNA A-37 threonylcarbamoyl transferase component Bud32
MGEVHLGRDTRLDRVVAIKVLRADLVADADARRRFEREARAAAALNHPGIVSLFDVGVEGDTSYLVMEYIEGRTLEQVLAAGAPPVARALDWAVAIADAVAAAHAAGLVHRDLKPGNVMETADGRIKVLDFGLAKPGASAPGSPHDLTTRATSVPGMLVGTAAYMAPEQIEGRPVDARTDVFAFGALLYELLSGRAAFAAASPIETLHAALASDPEPLGALVPGLPRDVDRIVRRCLRKDPRRRFQTMADLKVTLEDARDDLGSTTPPGAAVVPPARPRRRAAAALAGAALVAAGAVGGIIWARRSGASPTAAVMARPFVRLTADAGLSTEPSISADGRLVAFASDRAGDGGLDIWVQQTSGGPPIRLTADPTDDHQPDVSPDGGLVAFRSERDGGGVYVVPALGGEPRLLAPGGRAPRFSPDGRSLAFWTGGWLAARGRNAARRVYVVPTAGGEARRIAGGLFNAGEQIWAPDGRALLLFGRPAAADHGGPADWWWAPLDGRAPTPSGAYDRLRAAGLVLPGGGGEDLPRPSAWSDEGVVFAAGSGDASEIWTIPVDAATGRATGGPRLITAGPGSNQSPAVSSDGRLVFAGLSAREALIGLPLDANEGRPTGPPRPLRNDTTPTGRASASADGRLIAFPLFRFAGSELWIRDQTTGRERELVSTPAVDLNPVISADGRWVAYSLARAGYVIGAEGGAPRQVCEDCAPFGWLENDKALITLSGSPARIGLVEVGTGRRSDVVVSGKDVLRPAVAPGERWIAFNTRDGIWVAAFHPGHPPATSEWIPVAPVVQPGDRACGWSPDGTLLYLLLVRDGFRCLYAVRIDTATGRPRGEVFPVYHFHDARTQWGSTGYGSAVVNGLFLAYLVQYSGNIWSTSLQPGR